MKKKVFLIIFMLFEFFLLAPAKANVFAPFIVDATRTQDGNLTYTVRMYEMGGNGPGPGYRFYLEALWGASLVYSVPTPIDSAPDFEQKFNELFGDRKSHQDQIRSINLGTDKSYQTLCASYSFNDGGKVTVGCAGVRAVNACEFTVKNLHRDLGTIVQKPVDVDFALQVKCVTPANIKLKDQVLKSGSCHLTWKDDTLTKPHRLQTGDNSIPLEGTFSTKSGFTGHCEASRVLTIDVQ